MPCITVCFSTEIFYVLSLQVCNIYWLFEYLCLKREKADLVHSSTKINRFGVPPPVNLGLARGGVQKQLEAASGRETGVSCPHRTWYMCMYMCMYQRCTNRRCSQGHAGCFTSVELVLLDISFPAHCCRLLTRCRLWGGFRLSCEIYLGCTYIILRLTRQTVLGKGPRVGCREPGSLNSRLQYRLRVHMAFFMVCVHSPTQSVL